MKKIAAIPNVVPNFYPKGWYTPKDPKSCPWSVSGTFKNIHGTIGRFEDKDRAQAMSALLNRNGGETVPKKIL